MKKWARSGMGFKVERSFFQEMDRHRPAKRHKNERLTAQVQSESTRNIVEHYFIICLVHIPVELSDQTPAT